MGKVLDHWRKTADKDCSVKQVEKIAPVRMYPHRNPYELYGISHQKGVAPGREYWKIRVSWGRGRNKKAKRPVLEMSVYHEDHNGCCWESLAEALRIRNLLLAATVPPPTFGVICPGIYRSRGVRWLVSYQFDGDGQSTKSFKDSDYLNNPYLSFQEAVKFRVNYEHKRYGCSSINTYNMQELYASAVQHDYR